MKRYKNLLMNDYFHTLLSKGIIILISVISSSLLARYLGVENRGKYSYIMSLSNIIFLFLNLGIYQSYNYYKRNKKIEKVESVFFSLSLYMSLLYLIIFMIIFTYTNNYKILIIGILTVLMMIEKQLEMIILIENIVKKNKIVITGNIFNLFIYLILIYGLKVFTLSNIFLVIIFNTLLKIYFYLKSNVRIELLRIKLKLMKEIFRMSFFPMITNLMITLNYRIDIFMLKRLSTYEMLGLYTIGVGLAEMAWIVPDSFKQVLFSRTVKKTNPKSDIIMSIKINLLIMILLNLFILIFGKKILLLLYGISFVESYEVTKIIFIGLIPMIFFKLINTFYISEGKQKYTMKILSIAVLINLLFNYYLIPRYSIEGAAISSVFSYSFSGVIFLYDFLKKYNIKAKELISLKKELKLIRRKDENIKI